jgi:type II restriction/modification system DNA methylase subunit YeeA
MIGFDDGSEQERYLDDAPVAQINADLSSEADLTRAQRLNENTGIAFIGTQKSGSFDIPSEIAVKFTSAPVNPNGRFNKEVLKRYYNASDITGRWRGYYIIDFNDMSMEDAAYYELPFAHVQKFVRPQRDNSKIAGQSPWWLHWRSRPDMRMALAKMDRFILTPRVSKHRVCIWVDSNVLPDSATVAFARDDDYFFGVLHSKLHEVWALRQGTQLREKESGNRYTPTTTFETFPFPWRPGEEPPADPRYQAIAAAAKDLNEKREAWLNPPNAEAATLRARTLTNLYNALQDGSATWLAILHEKLDRAVCAAYGWDYDDLCPAGVWDEEEVLRRLLALNLERAGGEQA